MKSTNHSHSVNSSSQDFSSDPTDPYKWQAYLVAAMVFFTPIIALGAVVVGIASTSGPAHTMVATRAPGEVPVQLVSAQTLYKNTCMVCHGDDGQGVPRLGKPLRNSAFVQAASDEALFDMIALGRLPDDPLNTTGSLMPPRGAQNISDEAIHKVVGYLREMQDTSQPVASLDAWIVEKPAVTTAVDASILEHPGREIFVASCSACHGANGEGIEGLGKSFVTSEFIALSSDKELMTMIKMGRPIWDPANTTGIDMPSKGGNPAITDDQLNEIISYIRSVSTVSN
tara:strand:+ start:137716 stop:138570 length:855 start_codon:yes stop_codon:yes gene_type:complete